MNNPRATAFLTIILIAPAIAFADDISGRSRGVSKNITFTDELTDQQDLKGNSARCNFLLGSRAENGSQTSSIAAASLSGLAKGEQDSELGMSLGATKTSDAHSPKLVDFGLNPGGSSDKDKGKGKGKYNGTDNGGNAGVGNSAPSPLIAVPEPGAQTLLLVGLAGFGVVFYRRKTLTNAILQRA